MANVGISEITGEPITGWDRTVQGLRICIRTQKGQRVQRRDFGGTTDDMIDRPQNAEELVDLFVSLQEAIEPRLVDGVWYGEPCFGLRFIRADFATPAHPTIELSGVEFPNGHLGDFTTTGETMRVVLPLQEFL